MEVNSFEELAKLSALTEEKYRSDDIHELMTAFSRAQGNYPVIRYNRETSIYQNEYTDLDLIMRLIRPVLSKESLTFTQITKLDKNGVTLLDSFLFHSSGQWIKSQSRIVPSKDDKMVKIAEINTEKRIQAQTILNVTVIDDLLDDPDKANEPFEQKQKEGTDLNYKYDPRKKAILISKDELKEVQYELKDWADIAEHLLERLKIETFADMPKDQYRKVINYIHETIKLRTSSKNTTSAIIELPVEKPKVPEAKAEPEIIQEKPKELNTKTITPKTKEIDGNNGEVR